MRMSQLSPRWVHIDMFIFLCPHCQKVWLSCKRVVMSRSQQYDIFEVLGLHGAVVPCKPEFSWQMKGSFENDNFTVSPSLDASASGHWHGHIKNGQVTGV